MLASPAFWRWNFALSGSNAVCGISVTIESGCRIDRLVVAEHGHSRGKPRSQDLLAVEHILDRLTKSGLRIRVDVLAHDEIGVVAGLGLEDLEAGRRSGSAWSARGLIDPADQSTSPESRALTRALASGMPKNTISSR